jgi:PHD/YefM family antitoxin component YafN of YafNO toxin-antitoxin module
MSVLDDFVRMRFYRTRASEFEMLAETEPLPEVRLRYRVIARHYRELADRDERSDKARTAEHLELLRLKRREAAE